jgi:hypothetical protein
MTVQDYLEALGLILQKLPEGHWLISFLGLIITLKLLIPRIEIAFRLQAGGASSRIRRQKKSKK